VASYLKTASEPILLLALSDTQHSRRIAADLRRSRIPFIHVTCVEEALTVQTAVGSQIVGIVTDFPHRSGTPGSGRDSLLERLEREDVHLPMLIIGEDMEDLNSMRSKLPPGSDCLVKPFSDGAWCSRLDKFRDFAIGGKSSAGN
jgi:hypothetical protein